MINYKIKDKNTSLILCIFGGWFGLHHFYNKKIGLGLLYLFTGGLFCIGWILDIVKIVNLNNNSKVINNDRRRICVNCKREIKNNSLFCPFCGYDLNTFKNTNSEKNTFRNINNEKNTYTTNTLYKNGKARKLVDDYIVFDLETTGLNANDDKIIEIGALKYKNNELIDAFNVLINPEIHISSRITKITGIDDDMVKDCKTIEKVLPDFINWIEDYTLIAHNASFDLGFIESKLFEQNLKLIQNKNIDTLYLARRYINDTENHKLETLKEYFNLKYNSHRATDDCYVTNHVYQYCKSKEEEKKKIKA